jgi:hypothetical protein
MPIWHIKIRSARKWLVQGRKLRPHPPNQSGRNLRPHQNGTSAIFPMLSPNTAPSWRSQNVKTARDRQSDSVGSRQPPSSRKRDYGGQDGRRKAHVYVRARVFGFTMGGGRRLGGRLSGQIVRRDVERHLCFAHGSSRGCGSGGRDDGGVAMVGAEPPSSRKRDYGGQDGRRKARGYVRAGL